MLLLRIIFSLAAAALLVLFLNNLMGAVRPLPTVENIAPCASLLPSPNSSDTAKYDNCAQNASQKMEEQRAYNTEYALIRAVVALIILIAIAILIFRRLPFYSGALVLGGLLFVLIYPNLVQNSGSSLSEAVREQTSAINAVTALIGFISLSLADIFFLPSLEVQKTAITKNKKEE